MARAGSLLEPRQAETALSGFAWVSNCVVTALGAWLGRRIHGASLRARSAVLIGGVAAVASIALIVIDARTDQAQLPAASRQHSISGSPLVVIAVAVIAGAIAAGRITAPLRTLSLAVDRFAKQGTSGPLPASSIPEVAGLTTTFAQLQSSLAARTLESERTATALADALQYLSTLIHSSPVGVIGLDTQLRVREWNPAMERLVGWQEAEARGRVLASCLGDEHAGLLAPPDDPVEASSHAGLELRLRTSNQGSVDVGVWTAPLHDHEARLQGWLLLLADISDRKRLDAERARRLQEEAQRANTEAVLQRLTLVHEATAALGNSLDLQTTAQHAADAVVPRLADWCIVEVVGAGAEITAAAHAAVDVSVGTLVERASAALAPLGGQHWVAAHAVETGQAVVVDAVDDEWLSRSAADADHLRLLRALKPRSILAVPLPARGQALGAMTLASITTPRYDATTVAMAEVLARRWALALANAQLHRETDEALRARETTLSVASHELGGPLARLKLHVEVVLLAAARHALDEALLKRSLTSIERATNRLATITQDLLKVSGWARGDLAMNIEPADLGALVREVARGYRGMGGGPSLVLRIGRERHMVQVDTSRIEQVCENLLDNAFKYSPAGGEVQVSLTSERGGGELLQVRDTGIGLRPIARS